MTLKEHKERHLKLHEELDELIADFITHNEKSLSDTTIMEFLTWSYKETLEPTEENN